MTAKHKRQHPIKWLSPLEPPRDSDLIAVWRMYEKGRLLVLQIHKKQVGSR